MKKTILLILVCSLLLLTVTSCLQNNKNEQTTPQDITESTTPHQSNDETTTPDNLTQETTTPDDTTIVIPPDDDKIPFADVFGYQNVAFTAQPFIQDASIESVQTEIEIEALNWAIKIDNVLYSSAKIISNPTIIYPQKIAPATNQSMDESFDTLSRIQNSDTCCMLETMTDNENVKKLAVYNIEGVHYLLTFHENGNVAAIYYVDNMSDINPHIIIGTQPTGGLMSQYATSAKVPVEWKITNGDIPISLSFGLMKGSGAATEAFSDIIFLFENNEKQHYEFKKIDITEIEKTAYSVERVKNEEGQTIGYNYTHTELIELPLSIFSTDSGYISISMSEYMNDGTGKGNFGSGSGFRLYYKRNGENIVISASALSE